MSDPRAQNGTECCDESPLTWRSVLTDLLVCAAIAVVLCVIFLPVSQLRDLSLAQTLESCAQTFVITLCIGTAVGLLFRTAGPVLDRRLGRHGAMRWIGNGVLLAAGVAIGGEIALRLLGAIFSFNPSPWRMRVFQIGFTVSAVVVAGSIAMERLRQRARDVELREQRARQEALRAQLAALQARTNPHFLFNSLNTAAGLIETDPRAAENVLERLSGLFRYALASSQRSWVRLDEELKTATDYLEVEKVRFGDRLGIHIDVGQDARDVFVPPLVLQPLVENAVLHGVAQRPAGGSLWVGALRAADVLVLSVEDDGPGPGASSHRGAGTAMTDLRERLELVYEGGAAMVSGPGPRGGFRVELRLPARAAPGTGAEGA